MTLAAAALAFLAHAETAVSLAGTWHVKGEGFTGEATLPGTLAAAHLGKRWTEHDFQTTMDLPQSEALVQEYICHPDHAAYVGGDVIVSEVLAQIAKRKEAAG